MKAKRAGNTDERAFEQQLLAERSLLLGLARKRCRDRDLAEDLVQQTFLKAWQHRAHFTPGTNLRAWLCTILKNSHLNVVRKSKREPVSLDDTMEWLNAVPAEQEDHLRLADVARAFTTLSPTHQLVLLSAGAAQDSYEDVATRTGWPLGTVRSRLSRARKKLSDTLDTAETLPDRETGHDSMIALVAAARGLTEIAA